MRRTHKIERPEIGDIVKVVEEQGGKMADTRRLLLATALMFATNFAAAQDTLPPDVVSFNHRKAPCFNVTGSTMQEVHANLAALQKTKSCIALEQERQRLLVRYRDNKVVTMVLHNGIGFSGIYVYPAPHPK